MLTFRNQVPNTVPDIRAALFCDNREVGNGTLTKKVRVVRGVIIFTVR